MFQEHTKSSGENAPYSARSTSYFNCSNGRQDTGSGRRLQKSFEDNLSVARSAELPP